MACLIENHESKWRSPPGDEFRIIYGPNGVGKTRFLEAIQALTKLAVRDLMEMPLRSASIDYDDGTRVSYERDEEGSHFRLRLQNGELSWDPTDSEV
ncbi:MAG: hypothetical protein PGN07_02880, partial [Aeromicrobium erythreum]